MEHLVSPQIRFAQRKMQNDRTRLTLTDGGMIEHNERIKENGRTDHLQQRRGKKAEAEGTGPPHDNMGGGGHGSISCNDGTLK